MASNSTIGNALARPLGVDSTTQQGSFYLLDLDRNTVISEAEFGARYPMHDQAEAEMLCH